MADPPLHLDSSDRPGDPVLVVFACLAPVLPTGGGTLVVTGSHRLTGTGGRYSGLRSAQVRERQFIELTGGTGDAFLLHPWLVHAVAPTALDTPRLMLLHFLLR